MEKQLNRIAEERNALAEKAFERATFFSMGLPGSPQDQKDSIYLIFKDEIDELDLSQRLKTVRKWNKESEVGGKFSVLSKMLLQLLLTLTLCSTFSLAHSHYNWSPSSSSTAAAAHTSEWRPGRATYYAPADPRDVVGGACGYSDLERSGYGKSTAGLSTVLFEKGQICGACFEVRCVEDLRWCIPGTSIIVTATNFCAPNYGFEPDGGGHCNPPNAHFVLPIEAFEKIAIWKASNMPVQYRRIKCRKEGGVRFTINGAGIFLSVLISNVAGTGDIVAAKVKGSRTGWLSMGRIWGQNWHISADLKNQPLAFEITSSDGVTLTSYNVVPKIWNFGQTFQGKQFES